MKGYTPHFFINAFVLICQNVGAWLLSGIFKIVLMYVKKPSIWYKISHIFYHNLVIVVFFLTASEMTLMAFFHFQQMAWGSKLEIASSSLAIAAIVYYVGFFLYMIYIVVDNKIYSEKSNNVYKDKLYILIMPFKCKNFSQRMLPAFYLFRKFATSAILVFLFNYPEL